MRLSSIYDDDAASRVFEDTVSLLKQEETPWGMDIQRLRLAADRYPNIIWDKSNSDRVMSDPDSMGYLSPWAFLERRWAQGAIVNFTEEEVTFQHADSPIEVFRETFVADSLITYNGKPLRVVHMRTNRRRGSGAQNIPRDELVDLIIKMEQILLPFVKFDNYVKKNGNRDVGTRAIATDIFLEAEGSPLFLGDYFFGNPMNVPCIVRFRTQNGKGAKPSLFRLQDVEEIIKTLKTVK